jgi:hypothetical protein
MDKVFGIIILVTMVIGLLFGIAAQIEWTIYLSLPLVIIFGGSAVVTFITKRIEAIICGAVIFALWPALFA